MSGLGGVWSYAVCMGQVLLVWWMFLPFVCESFHELGTYGHYPDLFRGCKCSGEVGLVVDTFLSMYSYLPTSLLMLLGDLQKVSSIFL